MTFQLKSFAYFILVLLLLSSCKSTHSSVTKSDKKTSYLCEQLVEDAKENIGVPYKFGGTNKSGLDCSGLIFTTYKKHDITLPRTSIEMSNYGKKITTDNCRKGDLIFFKTGGSNKINHVGLIVEADGEEIKFIHSSTKKGVIISSLKEDYYKKAFSQINRVVE